MKKLNLLKIASAALLATAAMAAQAAGPDWSLIITGPGIVVPPAPAQVAPVRVAPVVVAPPVAMPPPASTAAVQGHRDNRDGRADDGWERNRDRDRQFQDRFQERFQERENYWLERERAFLAREKAFLEREKQRQLVVENNQRASAAINDRARREQWQYFKRRIHQFDGTTKANQQPRAPVSS
jgi:DNA-binding helix-hairpin-helix protein with protein kinase domain